MLLYGNELSGHSYKVRLWLLLTGIAHEYRRVDLDVPLAERLPEFVAASRYGEVPVLVDEGLNHCQSNAILMHLARKTGRFAGASQECPRVVEWLCWEMNRIGFSVPNLRHSRRWERAPAGVEAWLERRALRDLQTLDGALASSTFLLASGPTIADLSCCAYLYWIDQAGLSLMPFVNVQRWLESIAQLDGWQPPDTAMACAPTA